MSILSLFSMKWERNILLQYVYLDLQLYIVYSIVEKAWFTIKIYYFSNVQYSGAAWDLIYRIDIKVFS